MTLKERLRDRIAADGPIPFEEFMEACLYDPEDGFFATGPLRSVKSGDFLTSPEVSPWFGRMLGRYAVAERDRLSCEGPLLVADIGAGSGSLLVEIESSVTGPLDIRAIDRSPAARDALAERGWNVGETLAGLPEGACGVILANELLDNLPAALAVKTATGWEERFVGVEGSGLALVAQPARPEVVLWCDRFGGTVPNGGMVEVQLETAAWLTAALATLQRGSVVVIDYGGTAEELEPRRTRGTLRTYRSHHLGPDPLDFPGETDVTVDVNFSALIATGESAGATVTLERQDDFLAGLGLADEISALRHRELALARDGDPMERLKVRSERTNAETLMHPRGLGDFRVLVVRKG